MEFDCGPLEPWVRPRTDMTGPEHACLEELRLAGSLGWPAPEKALECEECPSPGLGADKVTSGEIKSNSSTEKQGLRRLLKQTDSVVQAGTGSEPLLEIVIRTGECSGVLGGDKISLQLLPL